MKKIFVYGTLRKNMYNYDIYLKDKNSFRGYAYVYGTLYMVRSCNYPALLLDGHDKIIGEIHEVSDECLKEIDRMEGYISKGHILNDYDKIICDVYVEDEIIDHLPVYVYNLNNPSNKGTLGEKIECGDFVKYINVSEL